MTSEEILYSIPVKVVGNNRSLKCTIPKEIAKKLSLKRADRVIWMLYKDGSVKVKKETDG